MARGWESKAIEAQQHEAAEDRPAIRPSSEEQRLLASRRRTLELTRARAEDDLRRAVVPHHRQMLEQAIRALDDQINRLDR
ncbi:MAG TPA: hypothetical protein VD833_15700 [Vicinamibacterales bacterium]|nr:hypothetical protein [Vicinamibacterales bacterium]